MKKSIERIILKDIAKFLKKEIVEFIYKIVPSWIPDQENHMYPKCDFYRRRYHRGHRNVELIHDGYMMLINGILEITLYNLKSSKFVDIEIPIADPNYKEKILESVKKVWK